MARKVTDIPVGPGTFYIAPAGTAFPADPAILPLTPWGDIGYCVDEETEILTAEGWKRHSDLSVGEDVLTLDKSTRLTAWQPLSAVNRFPAQEREMLRMEGALHDSLSTINHRWFVERHYPASYGEHKHRLGDGWLVVESRSITRYDSIPCAAPCSTLPAAPKWTDAFVETAAWIATEGTRDPVLTLAIYQSERVNPVNCGRIRAALTSLFGPSRPNLRSLPEAAWRESVHRDNAVFFLNNAARDLFAAALDDEHAFRPGFLTSLTLAQLRLLIDTVIAGDGWKIGRNKEQRFVSQKRREMLDSLQMACALAGIRANLGRNASIQMWTLTLMTRQSFRPGRLGQRTTRSSSKAVKHAGMVWCPTTPNGTWLARRDGKVFFTGNSEKGTELSFDEKRALQWVDEETLPFAAPLGNAEEQLRIVVAQPTLVNLQYALGGGVITTLAPRTFADGATTISTPALTSPALAAFTAADVGKLVSGPGIPPGTYILTYTSPTAVVMSANATATGAAVTVSVGSALSVYRPPRASDLEVHYAILLRTKGSFVSGVQKYRDWQCFETMPITAFTIPYGKQQKGQLTTVAFNIMLPAAGGDGWNAVEQN